MTANRVRQTRLRRIVSSSQFGSKPARRSAGRLSDHDAGAILAFIIGALVVGAFAPKKTAGFAAPALRKLVDALR
jgi:hypothetical protein